MDKKLQIQDLKKELVAVKKSYTDSKIELERKKEKLARLKEMQKYFESNSGNNKSTLKLFDLSPESRERFKKLIITIAETPSISFERTPTSK